MPRLSCGEFTVSYFAALSIDVAGASRTWSGESPVRWLAEKDRWVRIPMVDGERWAPQSIKQLRKFQGATARVRGSCRLAAPKLHS